MNAVAYTKNGLKSKSTVKLDSKVFGLKVTSHEVLKKVYLSHLSSSRVNLAKVKSRGQVSGGGQKPWRQKGTGRARFGSSRNPIWRGGGVAFGPTGQKNFTKKINRRVKKLALSQALSLAAAENRILVIEDFNPTDGKTANASKLIAKLGGKDKHTLIMVEKVKPQIYLSVRNLTGVNLIEQAYLNSKDVLDADLIVITKDALAGLTKRLGE